MVFFDDEPISYATNTAIITTMTKEESESVRSGRASLDTMDNNPRSGCHGSTEESIYDDMKCWVRWLRGEDSQG